MRTVRSPTISLEITHKQNGTKTFKTVSGFSRVGTVIDFLFYIQNQTFYSSKSGLPVWKICSRPLQANLLKIHQGHQSFVEYRVTLEILGPIVPSGNPAQNLG